MTDDEAELVERARSGDRAALEDLLGAHYGRMYAVCRRLTGDESDALDACQEALIAVTKGLVRFDGRSSFSTWSYRIATNAALDELRRKRRRPQPGLEDVWFAGSGRAVPVADDPAHGAAARIDLDRALSRLAPEYRAAVVLRDVADLSYAEIAAVLDVPPGTVRSRIARGRKALAAALDPTGNRVPPDERQSS